MRGKSTNVPYTKIMRATSQAVDGLVCVDIYPREGERMTWKGPVTKQDMDELSLLVAMWHTRRMSRRTKKQAVAMERIVHKELQAARTAHRVSAKAGT